MVIDVRPSRTPVRLASDIKIRLAGLLNLAAGVPAFGVLVVCAVAWFYSNFPISILLPGIPKWFGARHFGWAFELNSFCAGNKYRAAAAAIIIFMLGWFAGSRMILRGLHQVLGDDD